MTILQVVPRLAAGGSEQATIEIADALTRTGESPNSPPKGAAWQPCSRFRLQARPSGYPRLRNLIAPFWGAGARADLIIVSPVPCSELECERTLAVRSKMPILLPLNHCGHH